MFCAGSQFKQKLRPAWDHVFSVRPFRCRTFSAQIVAALIRCSLTVQLFRVRIKVSQKAPNIGAEKVGAEMVAQKSCGPFQLICVK